jgi:signal transduction histidine kinase/ligand-binding sensor domain-containing protein
LLTAAQPPKIVFDHYGLEDGFNSREAMEITSTPNGLMWITSNDGLARFDGKRFKFYQHTPGDTNSLITNYCSDIESDKRGRLWINASDHLEVFDPRQEKFYHLTFTDTDKKRRKVDCTDFYYDAVNDIMWVATRSGLYYCKGDRLELIAADTFTRDKRITTNSFYSMVPDSNDIIWLSSKYEVCKLNVKTGNTTWIDIADKLVKAGNKLPVGNITSIYLDKDKTLWLGTYMSGLLELNTITGSFQQFFYRNPKLEQNIINYITQIKGQDNLLWLSAEGFGFTAFNTTTKQFTSYTTPVYKEKYGIKGNTYGLYQDKNNITWIGSESGLHKYDANKQLFTTLDLASVSHNTTLLPVSCMAVQLSTSGKDEIIWLHIPYNGGYRYDVKQQRILPVADKVARYLNPPTGVFAIHIDKNNILWISTNQYGLIAYDITADKIIVGEKQYFHESYKWATCFFADKNSNLWIGSFYGLYMVPAGSTDIVEVKAVNNQLKKENLSLTFKGICQDKTGVIWFSTDNTDEPAGAIGKYSITADKATIIYNEKNDVSTTDVDVREVTCDNQGNIYAIFAGLGLVSFPASARENPTLRYLTKAQGINSTYINYIQKDASGNIWCSNTLGIACYKPDRELFVNFSHISYGIENTSDAPLYLSPYTNNLYISQHNALRYLNTTTNTLSIDPGNLVISGFAVFNNPYLKNNEQVTANDIIRLNHDENMISIEFALLSYTNSADNTYSWILKGVDKEWIVSKNNIASYTNLKPGTYTFLVKAANSQGEWVQQPKELTIIIRSPFYQTWWFTSICIFILSGIIYWLMQQRINRVKARYQLRNKIAIDLHDEIGSTLTSISILSNVSRQAVDKEPEQAKEMLQQISSQSKNIQQSMSDIVWSIKPDNERIENLVVRMREYAAQTLEPLNIKVDVAANQSLLNKVLPMECRKDLLLIYKEAINNIAKHAGATVVHVSLFNGNKQIHLSIQDNGRWKGDNSGTGTKSMKDRAIAQGGNLFISTTDSGTTVTAIIPIP